MSKVLVTGAGGFIGRNLCEDLAARGHEVVAIDLHVPSPAPRIDGLTWQEGDFQDSERIAQCLDGVNIVVHLASAHLQKGAGDALYWDVNVRALKPFLTAMKKAAVSRLVHISSVGIYGNIENPPASEDTECHPQSVYGETKLAGEKEIQDFCNETDFPVVILRPAWVYGQYCPRTQKLYRTLKKKRFVMIGPGDNMRHPLYIKDMLDGVRLAMESQEALGQTMILGGPEAVTTQDLVAAFCKTGNLPKPTLKVPYSIGKLLALTAETAFTLIGKEPPVSRRSLEFFDTHNAFDITKAKEILKFNPQYSLEKGLEDWLTGATNAQ